MRNITVKISHAPSATRPTANGKMPFYRLSNCAAKNNVFFINKLLQKSARKHINCASVLLCKIVI
jgi:hypothetical protein